MPICVFFNFFNIDQQVEVENLKCCYYFGPVGITFSWHSLQEIPCLYVYVRIQEVVEIQIHCQTTSLQITFTRRRLNLHTHLQTFSYDRNSVWHCVTLWLESLWAALSLRDLTMTKTQLSTWLMNLWGFGTGSFGDSGLRVILWRYDGTRHALILQMSLSPVWFPPNSNWTDISHPFDV